MNVKHLERLKTLCGLKLQKDFIINMAYWQKEIKPKLGKKCQTAGCLAGLMGTDKYFTNLGYELVQDCNATSINFIGEPVIFYKPVFKTSEGYGALMALFRLDQHQVGYIFGDNSNSLAKARERIDFILNLRNLGGRLYRAEGYGGIDGSPVEREQT